MNNINYKVCVRCFTFNQAMFIIDTMSGFCIQQTDFRYICCIVDDASTDGEQSVIKDFLHENFDLHNTDIANKAETSYAQIIYAQHKKNKNCFFAVLLLKENHYSQDKSKFPYIEQWRKNCEYEAICEGDDYWINPTKLQKQINYLDEHPNCGITRTDVNRLNQETGVIEQEVFKNTMYKNVKDSFEDYLLNAWWAAPCTWVYRKEFIDVNWLPSDCFKGDIAMLLSISAKSEIASFDDVTAVYRVLSISASHFDDPLKNVRFSSCVAKTRCYFAKQYRPDLRFTLFKKICKETKSLLINRNFYLSKLPLFFSYMYSYYRILYKS